MTVELCPGSVWLDRTPTMMSDVSGRGQGRIGMEDLAGLKAGEDRGDTHG
jgi:hypothetical protein